MLFDLKNTAILQAVKMANRPIFKLAKFLGKALLVLAMILFILFSLGVLQKIFNNELLDKLLGACLLCLALGLLFLELGIFFTSQLAKPKLLFPIEELLNNPRQNNLAGFLDLPAAKACHKAQKKNLPLLFALLKSNLPEINFILQRAEISRQLKLAPNIKAGPKNQPQESLPEIVLRAAKLAIKNKQPRISPGRLLTVLAENEPSFSRFLLDNNLDHQDIAKLADWYERKLNQAEQNKKWWLKENLAQRGSFGRDFASGYSITLDKYVDDLSESIKRQGIKEVVGHQSEIKQVEAVLSKQDINNVLLVGEPGVGRESIFLALAQAAYLGRSTSQLNYKRFLDFDPAILAARLTSLEEAEAELDRCFSEAVKSGNIVLMIRDFQRFAGETIKPGELNICGILARYLPLTSLQIVAIVSFDGLHRIIERNSALLSQFEKVETAEASAKDTLMLLENYLPFLEARYKRYVAYKAIREAIKLSGQYITESPFPQKALRLIDEALANLPSYGKGTILRDEHIKKVVSHKTQIPLEDLAEREKSVLLNLEKLLHQSIVNQDEAVAEIASALRRARSQLKSKTGPMGSFLFLGPTGVGKTETAKAIAKSYFASEKRLIRLDMSEFQGQNDVGRIIGYGNQEGFLTSRVRENPFALVLLDEFEKAHPDILNLFLQVLDEGFITDGWGRKVDFQNTLIIATSNAAAETIRQDVKTDKRLDLIKEDILEEIFRSNIFRPELINRFDAIVVFKPLNKEHLLEIAFLLLNKLALNLKDKGISLEISQGLQEKIVELGYNPSFGAREMRRVIQDKVENVLAKAILAGQLKRGHKIEVSPVDFSLKISKI